MTVWMPGTRVLVADVGPATILRWKAATNAYGRGTDGRRDWYEVSADVLAGRGEDPRVYATGDEILGLDG